MNAIIRSSKLALWGGLLFDPLSRAGFLSHPEPGPEREERDAERDRAERVQLGYVPRDPRTCTPGSDYHNLHHHRRFYQRHTGPYVRDLYCDHRL